MSKLSAAASILLSLLLLGCVPPSELFVAAPVYVQYKVEFQPNGPPPMQTTTPNQKCAKGGAGANRLGCMRFPSGTYGVSVFGLTSEAESKACGDPGINWVITKIEATQSGDLVTGKGTGWGASLDDWVKDSFYPHDDPDNGVLYSAPFNEARTSVGLFNKNANSSAKDLWYRITATRCAAESDGTHRTNTSDPRIENDGN